MAGRSVTDRKFFVKSTHFAGRADVGLSTIVDVFDRHELFELLDNDQVLRLSQLGGQPGFTDTRSILRSTGIATRRLLAPGVSAADLAVAVCQRLEGESGRRLSDFSSILLCHSHTDPRACRRLAAELTLRFQLPRNLIVPANHGCAGFLKMLHDGCLLADDSGTDAAVALVSVETPELWHDAADRLFCGIVSAGATAAVIEPGGRLPVSQIRADDFRIPAELRSNTQPLFYRESGDVYCFRGHACHRTVMRMNPEPVFVNGIELMLDNLRSALLAIDVRPGQRVVVIPHQPSGKLLKALIAAAATEFPQVEFLNNLLRFGNTISSSVPTVLSQFPDVLAANECLPLRDGDHLVLLAAGICMTKMDDHMTAGHACLRWSPATANLADTLTNRTVSAIQHG